MCAPVRSASDVKGRRRGQERRRTRGGVSDQAKLVRTTGLVRLCLTADLETETMARLVPTNLGWHQHTVPCFFSLGGSARPEKLRCGFSECGHARGRVLYVVLARTSDRASVRFFLLARARQKFLDEPTHFFGGPREKTGEFSVRRTPLFWGHFQNWRFLLYSRSR